MNTNIHKGTALITGASSGIGAVYADRLARRGYDLVLVARNAERLKALATKLTDQTGRSVETISADLTKKSDLARVEQVLRSDASITLLLNNAGFGATAPLLASEIEKMEEMIAVNVVTPMRLTHAVAPAFVSRGMGTIINIASIAAVAPEMLNGVYGGSKAFLLAFSQSLHHELADKGVRVQAVLPGATATGFWNIAGVPVDKLPPGIVMTTENMVDAALSGLDQGEFVTIPSLPEIADWNTFEGARKALGPNLSLSTPGTRYAH
jgi:short-subunit dehydrogenase